MFGLSRYGDVEGGWIISAELSALLSPLVFRRASSPSSSWRLKQGSILALAGWMVVAAWLCAGVAEGVSMGGHHSCTVLEGGSVKVCPRYFVDLGYAFLYRLFFSSFLLRE